MLNQLLFSFVQVSITCSLLIILLLVFRNTISQHYYAKTNKILWLIIAIRLLIPIGVPFVQPIYTIRAPSVAQTDNATMSYLSETTVQDIPFGMILFIIWMAGIIGYLFIYFANYYITSKKIRRWSIFVTDKTILSCFSAQKQDLHIHSKIALKQSDYISSPVLIGLWKPTIYLSNTEISQSQLSLILKHELVHYKRKDIWFKLLMVLVTAFHWYNPLVHIMNKKLNIDMEAACDETVLRHTNYRNKKEYANAILKTVELSQKHRILLSTHFCETACTIRKRINKILVYRKRNKGITLCTIMLTMLLLAGSLIGIAPSIQAQVQNSMSLYDQIKDKQFVLYVDDSNVETKNSASQNEVVIVTYEPVEE